jgi:hypothetical protein
VKEKKNIPGARDVSRLEPLTYLPPLLVVFASHSSLSDSIGGGLDNGARSLLGSGFGARRVTSRTPAHLPLLLLSLVVPDIVYRYILISTTKKNEKNTYISGPRLVSTLGPLSVAQETFVGSLGPFFGSSSSLVVKISIVPKKKKKKRTWGSRRVASRLGAPSSSPCCCCWC